MPTVPISLMQIQTSQPGIGSFHFSMVGKILISFMHLNFVGVVNF